LSGAIGFESGEPGGTVFWIRIPIRAGDTRSGRAFV
jgi:hypothetical protein